MKKENFGKWLLLLTGFLFVFSFSVFSQNKPKISKEEFKNKAMSAAKSFPYLKDVSLPLPFNPADEPVPPVYKDIALKANSTKATPQPESLCDEGYYWMGGETYTADANESAIVWGAGGNLYFASVSDPVHPLVEPWGDIILRIRIHNNIALAFCLYYTYAFDISDPLNPAWLSYGPGYVNGFLDAYLSPDDSYWIMTDWAFAGGITVWDSQSMRYQWGPLQNPQNGQYWDLFVDYDKNVLIAGDYSFGAIDFYDISNIQCKEPTLIGQIPDSNCGLIYYDYPYLYCSYEPWQYYNFWIWAYNRDDYCTVSVYFLPDTLTPDNNFFVKEYTANYDIVSMKKSTNGFLVGYLQNIVVEWAPQFSSILNGCFINNKADSYTLDCAFKGLTGVAACSAGGARFFNSSFVETSHYITGEYAYDVVPWGDYLFVPSGKAGVAILDNSDPSYPRPLSFLETNSSIIPEIKFIAVSENGQRLYLSDGSEKVWIANISDKSNPFIISYDYYWLTTSLSNVAKLLVSGNRLLVASESGGIDLLDISNPNLLTYISSTNLSGNFVDMETFELQIYEGITFLATTDELDNVQVYDISSDNFLIVGSLNFIAGAIAVNSNIIYIDQEGSINPIVITGDYPFFTLSTSGTTPLVVGYTWGPPDYIKKFDSTKLVCAGNHLQYHWPAVFVIDIETDPLAPLLLPESQNGVMPFDYLTGLAVKDGLVYYATDYLGTGALTFYPDYDEPYVTDPLSVTPEIPDIPSHSPNPNYWLTGNVTLSITVKDDTSAITKVTFKYNNKTIRTLTNQTPAGQEGVYTFNWDTSLWTGSVDPARIFVEITDSGCNTTTYYSSNAYSINKPPSFEIVWEDGCNKPSQGAECSSNIEWPVCGILNFTVFASAYYYNEVFNFSFPIDDIFQIAYKIDDGNWVLYSVPYGADGAYRNYDQYISIDTTSFSDGLHTLYVRVTDDVGLQTFKNTAGISSWTFKVYNNGPNPQIVSPSSGYVLRTSSIQVTAHMNNEISTYPTQIVDFYLDSDPENPAPNGTLIGSSTINDGNNNFSIVWDASTTELGYHTLTCWAYYYGCCSAYSRSQAISINLVESLPEPPPEIAVGYSFSEALVFSEDKQFISWPSEPAADGYKLYRGKLGDLPNLKNTNIDSCTRYDGTSTSVDLSLDDPSAETGNLYWYIVTAYNSAGEGPAGNSRVVNSSGNCL